MALVVVAADPMMSLAAAAVVVVVVPAAVALQVAVLDDPRLSRRRNCGPAVSTHVAEPWHLAAAYLVLP